ncbi:MAG: type II toxin-antitoxin system VapC family toxin [Myxococcales bacterium]|nr:type II toxin-antitoxin system VapC family toxin [Myxococcales bacterium]
MSTPFYLLDTTVLVHLVRDADLGKRIDNAFGLRQAPRRPAICIVTHGEAWTVAERLGWKDKKKAALAKALDEVVTIDIHDEKIIQSYVEIWNHLRNHPTGSKTNIGENDRWIAAVTRVAGAKLLTTDTDFQCFAPSFLDYQYITIEPDGAEGGAC